MKKLTTRITTDDQICKGKPTIRGKRITVQTILEYLSAGDKPEDILKQYPNLEMDDIRACLKFVNLNRVLQEDKELLERLAR